MNLRRLWAGWILTAAAFAAAPALARDPAHELIRAGNDDYAAGRYEDALAKYRKAAELNPALQTPALLHDEAAALFKLGRFDDAREVWTRIKSAGDAAFEARTRYNLANVDYAAALAADDPQQALERLAEAAAGYREAVRLDPALADARANLELAHRLRRQIEEQQAQSPESQPSQGGQQGGKNQNDQQKNPSSQPNRDEQQQDPNQAESNQEQKDQSQSDKSQQQEQAGQSDEQQSEPQSEPDPNALGDEQQPGSAEEERQRDEQQSADPNQANAAHDPNQAQARPAETESDDESRPAGVLQMTRAEAERLLQKVRDAEKKRRELRARSRAARQKPVQRDW